LQHFTSPNFLRLGKIAATILFSLRLVSPIFFVSTLRIPGVICPVFAPHFKPGCIDLPNTQHLLFRTPLPRIESLAIGNHSRQTFFAINEAYQVRQISPVTNRLRAVVPLKLELEDFHLIIRRQGVRSGGSVMILEKLAV